ncbi:unnamed protein product [Auanema sp. JU1783]|nr:unnamed protein product [Auanema sp. JU1783]
MAKRLDLQELRGVFILQVLFFHFFPSLSPNGYVGVDEFFVLSGYLIALVLSRSSESYLDHLSNFYYSRIKRILPAYALFILISIISLYTIYPLSNIDLNMDSIYSVIFFYRNMLGTDKGKAYRAMLAIAEDIYTHTWSLAVEIQFYVLVPLLFSLRHRFKTKFNKIVCITAFFSWLFSICSSADVSFNNVFARFWQFLAGSIVFLHEQKDEATKCQRTPLVNDNDIPENESVVKSRSIKKILFLLISFVGFYPYDLDAKTVRLCSTVLISLAIAEGKTSCTPYSLLSRPLVYLGDISYVLYLVHWPVYVYLHLNNHLKTCHLTIGLLISIVISILFHEVYEKKYLSWDKREILNLLLFLYTLIFILSFNKHQLDLLAHGEEKEFDYIFPSNLTRYEAIKLNRDYLLGDYDNVFHPNCSYIDGAGPFNHCILNGSDYQEEVLMVIGNSYAPNNIHPLYEYCSKKFKKTVMYSVPACEVLYDTVLQGYSCSGQTEKFLNETASYQPDVLIIYTRHLTIMPKKVPTEEEEKQAQELIETYLSKHEKNVRRKILILDAFPRPSGDVTRLVNDGLHLSNATSRDVIEQKYLEDVAMWQLTRSRLKTAVSKCSKCYLIDYVDVFTSEKGVFQFYDTSTGVTYFNSGRHLTPHGLRKVRPLYKKLCSQI